MNAGNSSPLSEKLDFDYWSALAEQDPDGFEQLRTQTIAKLIDSSSEHTRQRLRGLQWQIDCTRDLNNNPLGACVAVSRMMWETYERLNQTLAQISRAGAAEPASASPLNATVLPFKAVREAVCTAD